MSTGLINKLKWGDAIRVNDVPQHTDFAVEIGDLITVALAEPTPEYPAQQGELSILYEDDHILAVDKPAGMLIHPSHSQFDGTLANFVVGYYEKTGQKSAFHPVTRLDRDTFGVVLLTKNAHIHALMQESPIQKTYHALVFGNWEENEGIIDAPIARKPLPSLLREVREDGKESVTEYRVLERFGNFTKLELHPITGRTHQLRVHCAHMGYPILGHPQYGHGAADFGLAHQLLCAKKLEFTHPVTGEPLILESKMNPEI
jgi:23S rRNA pseudouridine1911/1915/1917 synthase